ncbi:MAG: FAD-binding oxidoreductase [Rhizobiaceae bacterium]|nr:FAD-binding oxidoreductase [Rhizobiaceae bacterium]
MLLTALSGQLDETILLTGDRIPEKARGDASQSGRALPWLYVRPTTVDHVRIALGACNARRWPVTIQGGMTGLAGGANPERQDVVITLDRLAGIEEIDTAAGTMTLRAGTVLEVAQKAAEEAGFLLPIDLGARGSCQIGGNIATNAGGIRVIRHGVTRANILGLEAVLADGTVISSMNRFGKNNTGYDLKQLFIGSEGTLGVVTRAVIKLKPMPSGKATALVALSDYRHAVALLARAQADLPGLSAFEIMWARYFEFSARAEGLTFFDRGHPFTLIIEQSGAEGSADLETFLGAVFEAGLIEDALIAQSEKESRQFWTVREGAAYDRLPDLVNLDVSIAIGRMGDFAGACEAALLARFPDAHVTFYGHMGDSNLHIAVAAGSSDEATLHAIDEIAYGVVRDFDGAISAEHGIGLLKRDFLRYSRDPAELALMRAIKQALDPHGILNPGKVLPPP